MNPIEIRLAELRAELETRKGWIYNPSQQQEADVVRAKIKALEALTDTPAISRGEAVTLALLGLITLLLVTFEVLL